MQTLLDRLGNPERSGRFIHVAGTNGKGSTAAMIASALRRWGKRTGLFTSPHLIEPTERIQINGQQITDVQFAAAFEAVHAVAERLEAEGAIDAHPSYFETVTAMAFCTFAGNLEPSACEYSVIEVGLGGRLDATNVVRPEVAVITPVSFDHESFLGNTIEAIAGEKAGIIKSGAPTMLADQSAEVESVMKARALAKSSTLFHASNLKAADVRFHARGFHFQLDDVEYRCTLPGRHQLQNALTAIGACQHVGVPAAAIQAGLAEVQWPGRLEYISASPDLILDGAHNPAGATALASYIREFLAGRPVWMVYGTMRDKAIDEVIEALFPLADRLILTAPNFPRALRPQAVAEIANRADAILTGNVPDAIRLAEQAPANAAVLFTGSLFLVGEVRAALLRKMSSK